MQEIWKPIKSYPDYEVSNHGQVRTKTKKTRWAHHGKEGYRTTKGKMLKVVRKSIGYGQVGLSKNGKSKSALVHRLVAEAFIDNPKNRKQINHKDGNGMNNHITNLEWCTPSENGLHAYRVLGNVTWIKNKFGGEHPKSKPVIQKSLSGKIIKKWECASDAVRELGFDSGSITRCCQGKSKTHKGYTWEYA